MARQVAGRIRAMEMPFSRILLPGTFASWHWRPHFLEANHRSKTSWISLQVKSAREQLLIPEFGPRGNKFEEPGTWENDAPPIPANQETIESQNKDGASGNNDDGQTHTLSGPPVT
jgi:hypothetical protein